VSLDVVEQASDARPMDIDGDQRIGGMFGGVSRGEITVAGSDFDAHSRGVGKQRPEIELLSSFGQPPPVQTRVETRQSRRTQSAATGLERPGSAHLEDRSGTIVTITLAREHHGRASIYFAPEAQRAPDETEHI
jgi:hypothetical protein